MAIDRRRLQLQHELDTAWNALVALRTEFAETTVSWLVARDAFQEMQASVATLEQLLNPTHDAPYDAPWIADLANR